jgi:hypothetical protein
VVCELSPSDRFSSTSVQLTSRRKQDTFGESPLCRQSSLQWPSMTGHSAQQQQPEVHKSPPIRQGSFQLPPRQPPLVLSRKASFQLSPRRSDSPRRVISAKKTDHRSPVHNTPGASYDLCLQDVRLAKLRVLAAGSQSSDKSIEDVVGCGRTSPLPFSNQTSRQPAQSPVNCNSAVHSVSSTHGDLISFGDDDDNQAAVGSAVEKLAAPKTNPAIKTDDVVSSASLQTCQLQPTLDTNVHVEQKSQDAIVDDVTAPLALSVIDPSSSIETAPSPPTVAATSDAKRTEAEFTSDDRTDASVVSFLWNIYKAKMSVRAIANQLYSPFIRLIGLQ